jgi:transposase-like protein
MSKGEGGGRPTKFTPTRREAIVSSISKGVPYQITAEANGIGEETLYGWIRQGRRDIDAGLDTEFSKFSELIKRAEADKISYHLDTIKDKPDRWQADAWILERRWWKHFSSSAAVIDFEKRLKEMEEDKDTSDAKQT